MATARGSRSVFKSVGRIRPRRNSFDLSYDKRFTCDMGELIPIACDHVVPGDIFKIGCEITLRFQPLVAPIYHEVRVQTHWFFVPYRLLWPQWEEFITGGEQVNRDSNGLYIGDGLSTAVLPRWIPSSRQMGGIQPPSWSNRLQNNVPVDLAVGSLWDFLGFPLDINQGWSTANQFAVLPLDFPRRAYYFIWNEYYRDENLQQEVPFASLPAFPSLCPIMFRNWTKDYFTSSLPFQQKGVAPAVPLSGSVPISFNIAGAGAGNLLNLQGTASAGGLVDIGYFTATGLDPNRAVGTGASVLATSGALGISAPRINAALNAAGAVSAPLAEVPTFNVADIRLSFQIQKWLERNARGGTRYTEWLQSHYGVSPHDARLDRPEYIGGTTNPVIVSEVLQTSSTDSVSPQGNFSGHGLSAGGNYVGSCRVPEFGLIMGLMSVMPKPGYQDRLDRQFTQITRYDFFFPEFVHLSEQAILGHELKYSGSGTGGTPYDTSIFGYQGRYDEHRIKHDMVASEFRILRGDGTPQNPGTNQPNQPDLSHWHLCRHWNTTTALLPRLNSDFISCRPSKRIFAVPSRPGLIVNVSNLIRAIRPMPSQSNPGLVDHM